MCATMPDSLIPAITSQKLDTSAALRPTHAEPRCGFARWSNLPVNERQCLHRKSTASRSTNPKTLHQNPGVLGWWRELAMDTSDGTGAARRDGSNGSGGEAMGPHPPGAGGREEMISEIADASEGGFGASRSQSHNSSSGKGGMKPPRLVSVDRAESGESKRSTRSTHGKAAAAAAAAPKVERTTSSGSKKGPKVERTASSGSKKSASSGRKVKLEDDHDWVSKHMKIKIKAVGDILNHDEELVAMDEHLHEDLEATELTWKRHFEHEAKLQSHDYTNRYEVEAAEKEWQEAILHSPRSPRNSLSSPRTKNAEVVQVEGGGDGFKTMKPGHFASMDTHLGSFLGSKNVSGKRELVATSVTPRTLAGQRNLGKYHLSQFQAANDGHKDPVEQLRSMKDGVSSMSPRAGGVYRRGDPLYRKLTHMEKDEACKAFRAVVDGIANGISRAGSTESSMSQSLAKDEDAEETQVAAKVFALFKHFAVSGDEDAHHKHGSSMNVAEFVSCMEETKMVPLAISKKTATSLFKEVNTMDGSDYDAHEMSQFEFLRALEILSKRIGLSDVADLVFDAEQRRKLGGGMHSPYGSAGNARKEAGSSSGADTLGLGDISNLGNLQLEHMKSLLKLFKNLTDPTATEPELPMEVFIEAFQPVLKVPRGDVEMLFMKIDVNSDGVVTWNEFSSFILDMSEKGGSVVHGHTVFDGVQLDEKDQDAHHEDSIQHIQNIDRFGSMVSIGTDGVMKSWMAATGSAMTKGGGGAGKVIRAAPPGKTVFCMTALPLSSMIAVGADDFKIRFFDGKTLNQELSFDTGGRWPLCMTCFHFPEEEKDANDSSFQEKRELAPWLSWGDNHGEAHFIPESQLTGVRTHLEVVPFFKSSLKRTWDLRVFSTHDGSTPWCTEMEFVRDVGANGVIVVASSTGSIGVVSVEGREVLHYFHQHRLSVKALEWCGRQNNMMASAGLDRDIHLWRPVHVKSGKAIYTGALAGHKARVTGLKFHEARDVLFSLDSHSVILVWDLASRTLVCRLNPLSQNPYDINHKVECIMVSNVTRHLITATNHPRMFGVRALDLRDDADRLLEHKREALVCLYNREFSHLLTADVSGFVSLWQIETGRQFFKFVCEEVEATNTAPALTAASFDQSQRRLLVGWSQGSVQVYNFSNGTLLNNLLGDTTAKVTAITQAAYTKGKGDHRGLLLAAYDDGVILQWPSKLDDRNVAPTRRMETPSWMGADLIDVPITCIDFSGPSTLFCGRADGMIMLWDIQTGFLMKGENGPMAMKITVDGAFKDAQGKLVPACIRAAKFMNKAYTVCVVVDDVGCIQFVDTVKCAVAGVTSCRNGFGGKRKGPWQEGQLDGIGAIEVDDTDSFMLAGDCNGFVQVWDVSQVCSADLDLDAGMCIELFKWKAHKEEITSIRHVSKRNVFVTAARETSLQLMMWTITGSKIGILGASRWSEDELAAKVERCLKELEHGVEGSNNASGGSSMTGSRGSTPGGLVKIGTVAAMHVKKGGRLKGAAKKVHAGIQTSKTLGRIGAEMAHLRQVQSSRATSAAFDTEEEEEEEEDTIRGQVSVHVQSVKQLPAGDADSGSDPYCVVKLSGHPDRQTKMFENVCDAQFDDKFLYFVDDIESTELTIEVWDYDAGGEALHDFLGQVSGKLTELLKGSLSASLALPLVLKESVQNMLAKQKGVKISKNIGYMELKIDFDPIVSSLQSSHRKLTLDEQIKGVLQKHRSEAMHLNFTPQRQVVAREHTYGNSSARSDEAYVIPNVNKAGESQVVSDVTSLATARWGTSDFRNLAVYRLQDEQIVAPRTSGAHTERLEKKTRRKDADVVGAMQQPPMSARTPGTERIHRDRLSERLERSLEASLAIAMGHADFNPSPVPPSTARTPRPGHGSFINRGSPVVSKVVPKLPLHKVAGPGGRNLQVAKLIHIPRKAQEEHKAAEAEIRRFRHSKGLVNRRGSPIEDEVAGSTARMVGVGAMALPLLRRSYAESPEKKKSMTRVLSPNAHKGRAGHEVGGEMPHTARVLGVSHTVRGGKTGNLHASGAKTARAPRH